MTRLLIAAQEGLSEGLATALGRATDGTWSVAAGRELPPFLNSVDTVVYLAGARGRRGRPDPDDAQRVLTQCREAGVGRFVVVASAAIHEPSSFHPGPLREEELAAPRTANAISAAWRLLEAKVQDTLPAAQTTLLRATSVPVPGGGDPLSRLLERRPSFPPVGFDPPLQLLDLEDLAEAISACLRTGTAGVFHVAPPEVVPLRWAVRSAGSWRLPLPGGARFLTGLDPAEIDYLRYPWTVSAAALAERTGFAPRYSSAETVVRQMGRGRRPRVLSGFDPYGQDRRYIDLLGRTLFRFLHDFYWRVEWRGLENVPRQGKAVLVGIHRGFQPWDGVMILQLLSRRLGRYPRFLMHPTLVKFPVLAPYMMKLGGMVASRDNADWVLERDGLLGVYPEGIRGAFALYREAYKVERLGRSEWVDMALRHRAPIVPFVTVGTAESFPILGRIHWPAWQRYSLWPFVPVTSPLPLPSKWHTRFLPALPTDAYPPGAEGDPAVVSQIHDSVRDQLATAMAEMLARRRSVLFGSVFSASEGEE